MVRLEKIGAAEISETQITIGNKGDLRKDEIRYRRTTQRGQVHSV